MISVILPVYNEENYLGQNTLEIKKCLAKLGEPYEIIIVEESTDKTPEISRKLSKRFNNIKHFHFAKRLGKGKAVEEGILRSRGGKIIFMDIDLSVHLSALNLMIDKLDEYDVVVGSRYHPASRTRRTFLRLLLGRSYSILPRRVLGVKASDFQCGFKGFRRGAAEKIIRHTKSRGVFWDTEILFIAKKLGLRITEIPVAWVEKKTRSTKIGIKTICTFALNVMKLFFYDLLSERRRIR